jgi:hypothetical protein
MIWQDLLIAPIQSLVLLYAAAMRRLKGDTGDVSLISVGIIAAALAAGALLLTGAITGKLQHFIGQIPG